MEFVSLGEATDNPDRSVLTFKDASGAVVTRMVDIRLQDLESAVVAVDNVDSKDLAAFLLGDSKPILSSASSAGRSS